MNKGFITNTVLAVFTATGLALATYGLIRQYEVTDITVVANTTATSLATKAEVTTTKRQVRQLDLNDKQVVQIYGEIGDDSYFIAKKITQLAKNGKPIYVLLNSPGGSVLDGALIVSAIEGASVPVYTVVEGLCASMCQIIHAYGTKRMMVDRTVLMGHPASGGVQGTLEQMQSRLGMIQRYVNKFNAYIANRAGIPLDKYLNMVVSEMWLDAEDATALHFNDEVVNVSLTVVPSLPASIFEQKRRNAIKERMFIRW